MKKFAYLPILAVAAMVLAACTPATPTPGTGRGFERIWYVALDGDDDNSCADPTDACATLKEVVEKANSENTRLEAEYPDLYRVDHTINIAAGTYLWTGLHEGYPVGSININASILGAGEDATIIDGASTYGGLAINGNIDVTIRNLTIQNVDGYAPDSCVNVRGPSEVTLEHVTLTHCVRSGIAYPGSGMLTLRNVTSTENIRDGGGNGVGAILGGPAAVEDSTFSNNGGAGIISYGDGVAISNSFVVDNNYDGILINGGNARLVNVYMTGNGQDGSFRSGLKVSDGATVNVQGGSMNANQLGAWIQDAGTVATFNNTGVSLNPRTGIVVDTGAQLTIQRSVVSDNASFYAGTSLGGGLSNEGRTVIRESQFTGNQNGGLQNQAGGGELFLIDSSVTENIGGPTAVYNGEGSTMVIERSLIANNEVNFITTTDAALENRGDMVVLNTTVSGNNHTGVYAVDGGLAISFSTIAENGGYGLLGYTDGGVVSNLANNLIVKNAGGDCATSNLAGGAPLPTSGVNMDTDGTCGFASTYAPADILLDGLADNGGPTMTHALLSGSPAIDAASGSCPPNDQRMLARPFGASCDAGAYEAGSSIVRISGETDFDPEDFATVTPTSGSGIFIVIPDKNYNCREGNSTQFEIADTLKQGGEFTPIGIGQDKLWFQFEGPTYGQKCWAPTQGFTLYLDGQQTSLDKLPNGLLQVVIYPVAPTATPDIDESYDTTPTPVPTCDPQMQQCP